MMAGVSRRTVLRLALAAGLTQPLLADTVKPIGDEGVGPGEDLMREHGLLNRILLIYEEGARRLRAGDASPRETIRSAADVIRKFVEEYHEKLEEEHLFPRFERGGKLVSLVRVLRAQHAAGRGLTASILTPSATSSAMVNAMSLFVRMYRPHEAREDTVLFPAFRDLVTRKDYEELGERFEDREQQLFGPRGFERMVDKVAEMERSLGIEDLAKFTPQV